MKRWNVKGSASAKRRMSELRDAKLDARKSAAISEWSKATGKGRADWWACAQRAGLSHDNTQLERVQWLEAETRAALLSQVQP